MSCPLRIGLKFADEAGPMEDQVRVWKLADEAGLDHLWVFDHLAGVGSGGNEQPTLDSWSLMSAMAVATSRIRIGCLVTGNTYRHPVVLAKMAVTVDHLSGGRLEFGIGAGWAEYEHAAYGIPGLDSRVGRLSEALTIFRSLWTQDRTDFTGRHYQLRDAVANPKPVQRPHPPIWIGAGGQQTSRLVARHADVWDVPGGANPDRRRQVTELMAAAFEREGRDLATLRKSTEYSLKALEKGALIERVGTLLEEGISDQIINLPSADAAASAEWLGGLLPELRRLDHASG